MGIVFKNIEASNYTTNYFSSLDNLWNAIDFTQGNELL